MNRYWIDYSTSVCIEAENADEAERLFWEGDHSVEVGCGPISIDSIEEDE